MLYQKVRGKLPLFLLVVVICLEPQAALKLYEPCGLIDTSALRAKHQIVARSALAKVAIARDQS